MGLAYLEAQYFLAMFAKRFRLELRPGFEPRHDFHLSVGIKGGLPARVRRRKDARLPA
jgi:cytochrome P450